MHINNLPHEILAYIFTTIANDPTTNPVHLFPITNICTRWRTIALSTGNLWSRIALIFPLSPDYPSCILTLLVRSRNYPLDILMDLRDPCWGWNEDTHSIGRQEMENVITLLLPHTHRWRRVEVLTDTWAPIFAFLFCTRHVADAPMLEKLYLSRCNAYLAAPGQAFQPSWLSLPISLLGGISLGGLRDLTLVGVHLNWDYFPHLPNLRLLEFKYQSSDVMPSFKQFRSILEKCPNLTHLTIYGWGPIIDEGHLSQGNRVRLPNVSKLSLGVLDTIHTIMFLSLVELPSLEYLVLEDVSRVVIPTCSPDTTILLKWFCSQQNRCMIPFPSAPEFSLSHFPLDKIVSLELQGICTTPEIFAMFLQGVPSVVHLGINSMNDEMLETLIVDSTHEPSGCGCLVPQIRELECHDMDPEILLEVIASRPLDFVTLEYSQRAPPLQGSWMHSRLLAAGIEVFGDRGIESEDTY